MLTPLDGRGCPRHSAPFMRSVRNSVNTIYIIIDIAEWTAGEEEGNRPASLSYSVTWHELVIDIINEVMRIGRRLVRLEGGHLWPSETRMLKL